MLIRLSLLLVLLGTFFALPLAPTLALTESQQDAAIASLQSAVIALQSQNASQQTTINSQATTIATLQSQNTAQQTQINALKSITSGFSRVTDTTRTDGKKGTELFLTGFNLHVVNGLGATNGEPNNPDDTAQAVVNGLGNIIIGYNQLRGSKGIDTRKGSHNLIVGDHNNFLSYGGIVSGNYNTISGEYASVTAGYENAATATYASVSGGQESSASGFASTVAGGSNNMAVGYACGVFSGYSNMCYGSFASINAGENNQTMGTYSSVVAGRSNYANGENSCIVGGFIDTADGDYSAVISGSLIRQSNGNGFSAGGVYTGSYGSGVFHSP